MVRQMAQRRIAYCNVVVKVSSMILTFWELPILVFGFLHINF